MQIKTLHAYCALVGACDVATGMLLLFFPEQTMRLMLIPQMPAEPVYLRFIGAFVFGVGAAYWMPFCIFENPSARLHSIRTVFSVTTLSRTTVALFVASAVSSQQLRVEWLSVFATDALLAVFQCYLLKTKSWDNPLELGRREQHA